jgi:hypothetical protein
MNSKNLLYLVFMVLSGMLLFSCEGPIGPAGADGADGVDGINGTDGTDGVDGTTFCIQCHSLTHKNEVTAQYATSGHAAGLNVGYAGGRKACARCHSNEGFVETTFTGMDTTAFDIQIPTPIGCTTCHDSHNTFDFETDGPDYALRTTAPIDLIGWDQTIDMGNASNLCGTCHQPRRAAPVADANGNFNITSAHYGPHHGPHVTVLFGFGGYEFDGILPYPEPGSSAHFKNVTCVGCHMYEFEDNAGGHSFWPNDASCTVCHTSGVPDMAGEINQLLDNLAGILQTNGVLDADHHLVPGVYPVELAGAYYNWIMLEEDRSLGVHNPKYFRALLTNSIAALQ